MTKTLNIVPKNRITKIKLNADKTLEVHYSQAQAQYSLKNVSTSTATVHPDFEQALRKLIPHLILICDQKEEADVNKKNIEKTDLDKIQSIVVSGIVITGSGDEEGVMIIGKKIINAQVLNLISPITRWDDDYKFTSELGSAVEALIYEANEYLAGRKFLAKQEEIEFPEENQAVAAGK